MRASIVVLLLAASVVSAQPYYADVVFDVDGTGMASVSGTANHPLLKASESQAYTSKRGGFWLFNLTLPSEDVFSDYVFEIRLPPKAEVNYVKTVGQFRITTEDGRIVVRGVGKNQPFEAVIQYSIGADEKPPEKAGNVNYLILGVAAVILAAAAVFAWRRRQAASEGISYDPKLLSDRQKDIMRIIEEAGKPVNQALVCERLSLPKSSVSRNVDSLERMGLLTKTRNGMSTMLSTRKD